MSTEIAVVGVTFRNPDGTNRQQLLRKCMPGDPVALLHEPENKHDPNAIAVCTGAGQIGYLPRAFAAEYPEYMHGTIKRITGGGEGQSLGCIIELETQ